MSLTSTYTKNFFLPGRNLSVSSDFYKTNEDTDSKKKFVMSNENFSTHCATKKDIDLTRNVIWICSNCGHTHVGATANTTCPVCNSEYEIKK
jgi:rubrerythrin